LSIFRGNNVNWRLQPKVRRRESALSIEVIQKIYTPEMVRQWLAASWGPITYRNHTELAIEAWHWNSRGNVERLCTSEVTVLRGKVSGQG
jgi:hypothetical protein